MKSERPFYYVLAEHTPVPLASLEEWLDSVEYPATVAFTVIGTGYAVSTIFLGFDHNHLAMGLDLSVEESPPILFETAILSVSTEVMGRWSTFEEAMKEHGAAVERCQLAYALAMKG